jgi:hypothetical protein
MTRAVLVLAALALAACGEDPRKAEQRATARRQACLAEELAVRATANLAALDTIRTTGASGGLVEPLYAYQRAYFDYAKRREVEYAQVDSAAAARTPEDSVRHAGRAAAAAVPRPQPGSVLANAVGAYERDFNAGLSNPDHPCNEESA